VSGGHRVKQDQHTTGVALSCVDCTWRRNLVVPDSRPLTGDEFTDINHEAQLLRWRHEERSL